MSTNFALRSTERTSLFRYGSLICLWSFGHIVGVWLSVAFSTFNYQFFIGAIGLKPSLLFLIIFSYLPVALCAIGIFNDFFSIICAVAVLESVCRGFVSFSVYLICGSGAWALRFLLLFSSTVGVVLFFWMYFRYGTYGKWRVRKDLKIIAIILFLFAIIDRFWVSPFLIRISIYF